MSKVEQIMCVLHGGNPIGLANFYVAGGQSVFRGVGHIPICKSCIYKMVEKYYNEHNDNIRLAMYYTCRKIDVGFDSNILDGAIKQVSTVGDGKLMPIKILQSYMRQVNSLGAINNSQLPFDDGEDIMIEDFRDRLEQERFDEGQANGNIEKIKMSPEDRKIKDEVIRLIEYDPFEGFSESDQKFLYSDLLNYFGDEDVVEDQFLVSQIIQVVNNNNQIRKLDYLLSGLMGDKEELASNAAAIKSLNGTKKDIVYNTDKIAKENRISVKSRANSNMSKSNLTVMMERLRAMDFEDAEVDFYDQKKAYGMKRVADISIKAIDEQLQFDENDVGFMIAEQRHLIKELEGKVLDVEDDNRKLRAYIQKKEKKK
ncbi:MAG TPA: hypothetical protein VJY12_10635 [Dysgonamonadaceae bacterium]|nr:hypothetical protein [Dysgonamonadaceae bacterium]